MAKWIWNFGDFEIYHSMLLHGRRQGYGAAIPPMWKMYCPEPNVRFEKTVELDAPGSFSVRALGEGQVAVFANGERYSLENKKYPLDGEIPLSAGRHRVQIQLYNPGKLPAVYISGCIESDESWLCDDVTGDWRPVGCWDALDDPEKSPDVFPFARRPVECCAKKAVPGGVLYDFGREMMADLFFSGLRAACDLRFGESEEEAMNPVYCVIRARLQPDDDGKAFVPETAFRYVFLGDEGADISAQESYLPLQRRARFSSGEEIVDWVWETAAVTLALNCREFFLDGIKRDRWVWSADAYQTQFVHHYLFLDPEIEKRTLIALAGRSPMRQHINTIVDYSFLWVLGVWEYYLAYGDKRFLQQILPRLQEIMAFSQAGRDPEDGLLRGGENDWIFIDWADGIDKQGAVLGEQVLLAKALEVTGDILDAIGQDGSAWKQDADALQKKILSLYWDEEQGAFIDSFESGRRNVSRHCNLWAYLFLPCSPRQKESIYEKVVCSAALPQITTPYFKFYENQVHCLAGDPHRLLEDCVRNYYGPMKALGATALYEQFDPSQSGAEHYAMYNLPFDKSLCHAWSASPIYLIGAYRLGVRNTGVAYDRFEVRPCLGDLPSLDGVVPLPKGEVRVKLDSDRLTVLATAPGGTLFWQGEEIPLQPGEEVTKARHTS